MINQTLIDRARDRLPEWMEDWAADGLEWVEDHYMGVEGGTRQFLIDGAVLQGVQAAAADFAYGLGDEYVDTVRRRELTRSTVARKLNVLCQVYGERARAEHRRGVTARSGPASEPMFPGPPTPDESDSEDEPEQEQEDTDEPDNPGPARLLRIASRYLELAADELEEEETDD